MVFSKKKKKKNLRFTPTFLRANKGFFPSVQALVGLQLSTLDKCLPTVWVVTQIRPLTWGGTR